MKKFITAYKNINENGELAIFMDDEYISAWTWEDAEKKCPVPSFIYGELVCERINDVWIDYDNLN